MRLAEVGGWDDVRQLNSTLEAITTGRHDCRTVDCGPVYGRIGCGCNG